MKTHNMSQIKSLVNLLKDRSVPDFIETDYPTFVAFIEAYYEYLEQSKNTHDISINLLDYRDIDNTLDSFVEYFRKEFLVNIPKDILADKRLLVKQIKNFYLNKGNEASYKFLFRLLFNEDIEFYYPKRDILRASDGKWYVQYSLKITLTDTGNLSDLNSKRVTGNTSGANAIIESAVFYTERGQDLVEITISNIKGTFQIGETVTIQLTDSTITEILFEIYNTINITNGGSGYVVNDLIPIRDSSDVEIAKGYVRSVTKGPVSGLTIEDGGLNYNGEFKEVTIFGSLPGNHTFGGDYLPDTPADGSDSNSSGEDYTAYTFDQVITLQQIAGTGDVIQITDSLGSFGTGASGLVTVVNSYGTITEIELIDGGDEYENPSAEVISNTGTGAVISASGGGGSVSSAKVQTFANVIDSDYDSNGEFTVYPDFTNIGDGNATGTVDSGVLAEYPGRYLNDDGHLSSSKKLQDSFYYQEFSYVIKSSISTTRWRDIIKRIIHPAGFLSFGEVNFTSIGNSIISSDTPVINVKTVRDNDLSITLETSSFVGEQTFVNIVDGGDNVVDGGDNVIETS